MEPIRCYVVRIYRKDRHGMAGIVEDVRTGKSRSFRSSDELWSALSRKRANRPARIPNQVSSSWEVLRDSERKAAATPAASDFQPWSNA